MKSLLALLLVLSVLAVGITSSYADTIELTTDKSTYTSNDEFVIVSGQLDKFSERNFSSIQLFPPNDDNYLRSIHAYLDSNTNFSVQFPISELEISGTYTIASSDQSDGTNQFTTFEFVDERPEFIATPEQIKSINPIKDINEKLDALEQENADLKQQISDLNERIDNLLAIVKEQIKVMLANFS